MRKLLVIFCAWSGLLGGSVPPLEKEVSFKLSNEPLSVALARIQEQTKLVFSYQPALVNAVAPLSASIQKKTVREALEILLPDNITYKAKNNYIILKEKPQEKKADKTTISGYVYDKSTEQKVPNVTIYDKQSMAAVTTNAFGFYSITVPANTQSLAVNKENYRDTAVIVLSGDPSMVNFSIQPQSFIARLQDSLFWKQTMSEVNALSKKTFKKVKGFVNAFNVKDTLSRRFQVSLLPFIGTNSKLSGSVYNQISLNIYGGYAGGLDGVEVGGLFNIERQNVRGFQAAGLFNITGDSLRGTQMAGLFNISGRHAHGFQGAGLMNINEGSQKGFQAAGLMNINKKSAGSSVAGLMNISGCAEGAQLGGLANIQDTLSGTGIAGLFNITTMGRNNSQLSGLFNVTDQGSTRVQISSLFNACRLMRGVQIAPLNFADSATGVPIGLLSFVKNGVHQLEFSADELFLANLSFRTGVDRFYNIVSMGWQPGSSAALWQIGYGVGTNFKLRNKWRADVSILAQHISKGGFYWAASEAYRFYAGLEYRAGKKFSVAFGPTFNLYITAALLPQYESTYSNIVPYHFYSHTDAYSYNTRLFAGGKLALRFF